MTRLSRTFIVLFGWIYSWALFTAGVGAALLQGNLSNRGLYVISPAGARRVLRYEQGTRVKMLGGTRGLTDAPRLRCDDATGRMVNCGFAVHPPGPCPFLSYRVQSQREKSLDGAAWLRVDDSLRCGSNEKGEADADYRVQELNAVFNVRTRGDTEDGT